MVKDKDTDEQMGFDDMQDNVEPMLFDTLEEAKGWCEIEGEYVKSDTGEILYHGEECSECHGEKQKGMETCTNCNGTGKISGLNEKKGYFYRRRKPIMEGVEV